MSASLGACRRLAKAVAMMEEDLGISQSCLGNRMAQAEVDNGP